MDKFIESIVYFFSRCKDNGVEFEKCMDNLSKKGDVVTKNQQKIDEMLGVEFGICKKKKNDRIAFSSKNKGGTDVEPSTIG